MSNLKKIVRARMQVTGESYMTALARVREVDAKDRPSDCDPVAWTIEKSPPRIGNLLLRPRR